MVTFSDNNVISRNNDSEDDHHGYEENSNSSSSDEDDDRTQHSESEDEEQEGAIVLSPDAAAKVKPSFGSISVTNSSDVHFGNKTYYQGPVTIKQIVYAKNAQSDPLSVADQGDLDVPRDTRLILDSERLSKENDNPAFVPDENGVVKNGYLVSGQTTSGVVDETGPIGVGQKWVQSLSRQQTVLMGILGFALLASLIILTATLLTKHTTYDLDDKNPSPGKDEQYIGKPVDSPLDPNAFNLTLPKVKLISRIEWLAQPPVEPPNALPTPVPYVIIWHTATENCTSQAACIYLVRNIQSFHIESRHWWDIAYNFLVGGDGNVYEGRGWTQEGSHTYSYNKKSIGIAFIGTFISLKPPQWQIDMCKKLIEEGVEKGYIAKDYKLLAAKQLQGTQAPGTALYEDMKTWPHWSPLP